ncbi:AN1-type zinc finger protein 4 [Phytophthora pseudosyringae]|uniref:AN1-type zinc finger protein 4 n=1 Tax=Phytophthora pseudosyringae TaxID=221518 RepID=A0A8T1VFQ2_9STRA|nr:AN1-type zinc finger protein 4 [Phytophthora pseudosyringae]
MVTKTSTSSSAPAADAAGVSSASATSTATASSTVVASTPAPTPSDCLKAPPSGAASPSSVDASPDASVPSSAQRYARVPPAVLQSVKASLTYRKSCLKRSNSSVLPPPAFCEDKKPAVTVAAFKEAEEKALVKPLQKNRRRCWQCKVKVGLTAVKCRCDYTFCGKHRYAEEHHCEFNFKTAGKRKLEEENPVVVPAKVARIN